MARSYAEPGRMDAGRFKLREMAEARWGGDVSPHFDGALHRIEEAIAALPAEFIDSSAAWPPAPLPQATVPRFAYPPIRPGDDLTGAGAGSIAQAVAAGTLAAADLVEALLGRSTRIDPSIHAWAALDHARARAAARQIDQHVRAGTQPGPLAGVPVGVKDIFNTDGYPTHANSAVPPPFAHHGDARSVSDLRRAGALVLGKTATTEYAYADPSAARNPWNLAHTPGGSSSGSAAGVAARLIPAALGTQTAGSVVRPAAFCGVVGFKPSHERISRIGVAPLARSLDHVGTLTRGVADAALLYRAMTAATEQLDPVLPHHGPGWRIAFWPGLLSDRTDEATRTALRDAAAVLDRAGAAIDLVTNEVAFNHTDGLWQTVLAVHTVIMAAEVAAYHLSAHPDEVHKLGPRLRAFVEAGALVPPQALLQAQALRLDCWRTWHDTSEARTYDAVIVPAAPGTAPEGLDFTGDPSLNAPWTLLGVPAITIPIAVAENGLPLGMQLVAPYGEDAHLLAVAAWCEQAIGFTAKPML